MRAVVTAATVARSRTATTATSLHVGKGRVVVAVRTEDVTLALDACGEVEDLEVVERALELLMQLDVPVLRKRQRLIALVAEESTRFSLDILHESTALSTARERTAALGQRGERHFKQLVHAGDVQHKVLELVLEYFQGVLEHRSESYVVSYALYTEGSVFTKNLLEVSFSLSNQVQLLLDGGPHMWVNEVGVNL